MSSELDPKPGSPEAISQGCLCPPPAGAEYIIDANCPVHGTGDFVEPSPQSQIESEV